MSLAPAYSLHALPDGFWEIRSLGGDYVSTYSNETEARALLDRLNHNHAVVIASIEALFHRGPRQ
jgi:hypothetical protein